MNYWNYLQTKLGSGDSYSDSDSGDWNTFENYTNYNYSFGGSDTDVETNTNINRTGTAVSLFLDKLTQIMREEKNYPQFAAIKISLKTTFTEYIPRTPHEDKFAKTAIRLIYALYAFMIFCVLLTIFAKIHACISGADNVRVMGITFFGFYRHSESISRFICTHVFD